MDSRTLTSLAPACLALHGRSRSCSFAVAVAVSFGSAVALADIVTLSSGHTDVFEAEYEELVPGSPILHLGVHSGENPGTHYEPGDVILEVKSSAYTSTSGLPSQITNILGGNAWILPADQEQAAELGVLQAGLKRVGFPDDFSAVTFTMRSVGGSNPGNFALYSAGNALRLSAIGGTVGTSSFSLTNVGHVHYNWGFSAAGSYTFGIQASYTDPVAGLLESPVETYTFQVQAVPEPSTLALTGAAVIGVLGLRRRLSGRIVRA